MDREKKNILNEIKRGGPGFISPKGYFDSLENRIDKVLSQAENNERINKGGDIEKVEKLKQQNLMGNLSKDPGFTVPKQYFEEIESRFQTPQKHRIINLNGQTFRLLTMAVAASVLLVFGISYLNKTQNTQEQMVIQDEEIADWIDADLVSFDTYDIAEAFDDVELEPSMYPEEDVDAYLNYVDIENLILEN